ncbi:hypothetical protein [Paracidovorax cattleyae]|uniref:hypothetical protein n=1 Tax=Paracidovorax cattleyae TaxID=80868 RepID=UPI0018AFA8E6|nr:hypothetical protein [Paracidovorax cattleyae]MBF9263390.1 hypothetical protein [Paracidovorax cattleyae]
MPIAEYQQQVDDLLRDQAGVTTADARDRAIDQAVTRYSSDCPREVTEDVVWPQLGVFGPVPTAWREGDWVREVEYPIGQRPAALIHAGIARMPEGWTLESMQALPAGAAVRVRFLAAHDLETIPARHRLAVAQYAASLLCHQLAVHYSGQRESSMGAEISQTETRAREYAARHRELRTAYYIGTGQPDPFAKATAATASGEQPAAAVASWPGRRRLGLVRRGGL